MKIIINRALLFLLFLAGCYTLSAQHQGIISVEVKSFERKGDQMVLKMRFDMGDLHIRKAESRIYTPILVSVKHKREIELPKVIIKGSRRYKADRRAEALSGSAAFTTKDKHISSIYAIELFDKYSSIPYHISIGHKSWMADASINLREDVYGCCGRLQRVVMHRNLFEESDRIYEIKPRFRYIVPEKEEEKRRYEIGKAYLDFPQGQSIIDPSFRNNRQELNKINHLIVMLAIDADVHIRGIEMRGYASPESSVDYNYSLSSRRAKAMRDYFAHLATRIPAHLYQVGIGGEDWEGLKNLLMDYPVSHREEILRIIHTVADLDKREQMIKAIGGGEPYQLIFRDLYPQLRRVDCQINYVVRDFTVDEGKQRITNKPNMLSQNEMFQIARSYPEGSIDFNEALITAQKHFPGHDAANLNAAAVALSDRDAELANAYLSQVKNTDSPEYANCMGVLSTLTGDYQGAEVYLKRAQAAGIIEATHNLNELRKLIAKQSGLYPDEKSSSPDMPAPIKHRERIIIDGEVYIKENP